jgi:signal recognition particle receptor subunit beta
MPVVNPLVRELVFKVVYYGPGLGGKTTSLQHVHANTKPEHRGKMVSLATPVDRTLYFDFLPIRVPHVRGMGVRLQLFTVPGQVYYNATRKLVLTGVDGIVAVFDSQRERMDANVESLENLRENLRAHGKALDQVPHVIQYNKRDISDALSIDELDAQLNRFHAPAFATTATTGEGIYESLEAITRAVLEDFERRVPESRHVEQLSATLEVPEGGLADALRRADGELFKRSEMSVPAAAAVATQPSGLFNLSQMPEVDPGEALARVAAGENAPQSERAPLVAPSNGASQRVSEQPLRAEAPRSVPVSERRSALASAAPVMTQSISVTTSAHPSILPPAAGLSFEVLWPASERGTVQELERALALGDYSRAVACTDRLVARTLASAGALLGGSADAPRDPGAVALLLGLDGRRYLELRALVRDARAGKSVASLDALRAYATAIEARLLRARVGA